MSFRYIDGAQEPVAADVGVVKPVSRAKELAVRAERASRLAFVLSIIAAIMNGIMALLWNTWQIAPAVGLAACAVVWHRVNHYQRDALVRRDQGAAK